MAFSSSTSSTTVPSALPVHAQAASHDQSSETNSISKQAPPSHNQQYDTEKTVATVETGAENANEWLRSKKWANVGVIAANSMIVSMAASMFAPGAQIAVEELRASGGMIESFVTSVYVLGFAVGPCLLAPASERYGRVPVYNICNLLWLLWTTGCALSPRIEVLLLFRLLAGISASCPLTLGPASVGDLFRKDERGAAMASLSCGTVLGPGIGPLLGGYVAQYLGWRWIFWLLDATGGFIAIIALLIMRETSASVLTRRHSPSAKRTRWDHARGDVDDEKLRVRTATWLTTLRQKMASFMRPVAMLFQSPILLALSIYAALVYSYIYVMFTSLPLLFRTVYNFDQHQIGLTYIGNGLGAGLGLLVFGLTSDRLANRKSPDGMTKAEDRLIFMVIGSFLLPVGFLWYGWAAAAQIHWVMPVIGTFWVGFSSMVLLISIQVYLVDVFPDFAASAIAANSIARSLVGTFLPLAGPPMYQDLGFGWGNSILGCVAAVFILFSWAIFRYGASMRKADSH